MPVTGWNSQNVEDGTFTDCAHYLGTIRRGIGTMFASATGWTVRKGTFDRANNGLTYRNASDPGGRARITVDRNPANANYRITADMATTLFGGPIGRSDSLAAGDYYGVLVRVDVDAVTIFRFDDDSAVQLATTPQVFDPGRLYRPGLSFDGGAASQNVSAIETVTGATVARTADTTYTSGYIGFIAGDGTACVAYNVFADHVPASCTYVSPTLDAGSSLAADVAGWGESLGSGNITIDADLRDSGNSGTYDATALTTPTGSTFTSATGRYRNFRANITGNAQLTQMPLIDKGNDAGGGATIYNSGGRSGQRTKKVYVAVPSETIKKLKNSFA